MPCSLFLKRDLCNFGDNWANEVITSGQSIHEVTIVTDLMCLHSKDNFEKHSLLSELEL